MPTRSALTRHNRAAAAMSRACVEVRATRRRSKYSPLMPATSGDEARWIEVSAPCFGDSRNGCITAHPTPITPPRSPLEPKSERTTPGCRQLAVTPVPSSRRASSRVNSTLASLERP